jgi:rifampicin phosphotransferase
MKVIDHPSAPGAPVLNAPLVVELGGGVDDIALIGGKARGLERLIAGSLPCPPAFCVTSAALERYLCKTGLRERLRTLLAGTPSRQALCEAQTIAFAEELPAELNEALTRATDRLSSSLTGLALFAVRSSAVDEDSEAYSFAGLHETVLGIPTQGVAMAIRKCWGSLWSEAALVYRAEHHLPLVDTSMAVVVQALVPAEASAVVFTANPLTGATDEVLIHATCGLGPTLVDNQITPDIAVFDRHDLSLRQLNVGDKHLRIDVRPVGGLVTSYTERRAPALSEGELRQLARLAVDVEHGLGGPVDIEAALCGHWQLIQARPITRLR